MQQDQPGPISSRVIRETWVVVALFFVIWIVRSLTYPVLDCRMDCERNQVLLILSWKTVVWFILPMVYLCFFDHVNPFEFLRLKSDLKTNLYCVLSLVAIGAIWQVGLLISRLDQSFPNGNDILISIWGAGVCEEVLFRGFFLRKFSQFMSMTKAIVISSGLFVLAHLPGWLVYGGNTISNMLYSGLYIFVISIIVSVMVKRTRCLYPSISFHIIADLIAF